MRDIRLKGIDHARLNDRRKYTKKHPWHKPYKRQCLMCGERPYHDGQIYWSLCLKHLQETQCGPYRLKQDHEEHGQGAWVVK